ncbi:MAG: tRNA (N6-isopentenyl adenosine(37)-C2)-methylthiotransferase MiaB [Flavobacteriales bacterium]|nr:tRNA (N6-isopentenyl adenosine(37)-C2)-methylthiotransferase MiaB [Flavobacteriales bacterium]
MEKVIDESKQGEVLKTLNEAGNKKLFIESYGCQMNFSDSEIVASIMEKEGYSTTKNLEDADLVLVNTCSVRDKAEQTIRKRLGQYKTVQRKYNPDMKVGVMGCMAERLKVKFLEEEKIVDLVVGPDAYKDLPNLVNEVESGRDAVNVQLSLEETYEDIKPIRLGGNGVTAFVSITRGCDNMCTFCVVPYTRGRERSRNPESILKEVKGLWHQGYKEITLLGQNVDSYLWYGGGAKKDFHKASDNQKENVLYFNQLLDMVAEAVPKMRIRFATSNPHDMSLDVLHAISRHRNVCKYIHLPVQSGSTKVLKDMNRQHTREEYIELINNIRSIIPGCVISHDMISGFPGESEEDHKETLSLMEYVKYGFGYMFAYSERPGTGAEKNMEDDVPLEVKKRRLAEIIELQNKHSHYIHKQQIGKTFEVLIESTSKRSDEEWQGRTSHNSVVVFPKEHYKVGDFVNVEVFDATTATLKGKPVGYSENN